MIISNILAETVGYLRKLSVKCLQRITSDITGKNTQNIYNAIGGNNKEET
jgi:hypothetical protein